MKLTFYPQTNGRPSTPTTVEIGPDETILEAFERAGVPWLFGCRQGACRVCLARVVKGQVKMPRSTAIKLDDLKQGWVLTCVAKAGADLTLRGVQAPPSLAPLPWTD